MTDDINDRLAQLAARRAAAGSAKTRADAPSTPPKRHTHKARVGRAVAAGLSSSAFFSIVGVLAANATTTKASTVATARPNVPLTEPVAFAQVPTTRTTVVIKVVHHKRFVDPSGHPVPPPTASVATIASHPTTAGSYGSQHSSAGGTQTIHSPANVGSGPSAPTSPAAPPTQAPPATTPPTKPVAPPTTVYTPPPPPPPPPCTGSKCP